jgi:hypothetical protein
MQSHLAAQIIDEVLQLVTSPAVASESTQQQLGSQLVDVAHPGMERPDAVVIFVGSRPLLEQDVADTLRSVTAAAPFSLQLPNAWHAVGAVWEGHHLRSIIPLRGVMCQGHSPPAHHSRTSKCSSTFIEHLVHVHLQGQASHVFMGVRGVAPRVQLRVLGACHGRQAVGAASPEALRDALQLDENKATVRTRMLACVLPGGQCVRQSRGADAPAPPFCMCRWWWCALPMQHLRGASSPWPSSFCARWPPNTCCCTLRPLQTQR